jgi:alkylation response protein AidB-like acyl-CoA dehydrogenase
MIDLIPTSDQQDVADTIKSFLQDNLPVERHRSDRGQRGRHDFECWTGLAGLGCFGLSLPQAQGGVGMGMAEEVIAFREYGRFLLSPSILATVLAVRISADAGLEQLASLLSGERRAALANSLQTAGGGLTAGELQVFDLRPDDLVVAWNSAGVALFDGRSLKPGEPVRGLDVSVSLHHVRIDGVQPLAWVPSVELVQTGTVLLSAMLVGITEAVRDMAVSYAQTRMQFGQAIGSFQAVKHRCVNMALDAEVAWAQTAYAALAVGAGDRDAAQQVIAAKLVANNAAIQAVRSNIQVHGGIGFTAELNANLYLKRAHLLSELGGNTRVQQRRMMQAAHAGGAA